MPELKTNPQLKDIQQYVKDLEEERGFSQEEVIKKCLLLGEEIGELFKAIRKEEKLKLDSHSKIGNIKEELADIIIYICAIANRYNIDLEDAFRNKEEQTKKRKWE